jgi:ATPase subunit of ABC transporter with duplicated ATPase domains
MPLYCKNIQLILQGQKICIVGENSLGKSTLLLVVC